MLAFKLLSIVQTLFSPALCFYVSLRLFSLQNEE